MKDLSYYLNLKYPVTLVPAEEGGYLAKINELKGCITQGETTEEVLAMIEDAREVWITDAFKHGDFIPEPVAGKSYSGKFIVRIPKSLHRDMAHKASEEGVSLNQYALSILSKHH